MSQEWKVTGSSCLALKSAVHTLNRLDDFHMEKIGAGFFSEVFKVTHKGTGEVMVLKMNLLRSNRPNMLKEVQLMNQLSHPNILGFMGVCVHEGQLHALTEYINGGRLEQYIQDRTIPLPHCMRMKLALDIAKGMEYLHFKDIFHRDLTSKNIFVRQNEESGELSAVVGDFGFATKIPRCGYRLSTAGSPYWMSPECLKGKWYDQTSDIFSYGIILCELIARVEADPDVLPRTENFGLDYIAFAKLCLDMDGPPPPQAFLKLAFTCCNYDPSQRPSFAEIVPQLESIMWNWKSPQQGVGPPSTAGSIPECTVHSSSPCSATNKDHAKLCHRRSLSDDGIRVLSETMASLDKHYKPSAQNPFANITSLKGGKKIVDHSSSDAATSESDASYESGTVVAEPVVKPSKVLENLKRRKDEEASLLDAIVTGRCFTSDVQFRKDKNERLMRLRSEEEKRLERYALFLANFTNGSVRVGPSCPRRGVSLPVSLPSSPTFTRRSTPKPSQASLHANKLRHCSSGSNLPCLDDGLHSAAILMRRRGSCESGFFSSVGEDFGLPGELIASSVTLSSSSAASSLLLDSGGAAWDRLSHPHHHLRLTASSDDLSVGSDILLEERSKWTTTQRAQQIHKMVEYFERKGTSSEHQREYYRQLRVEPPNRRRAPPAHRLILCDGAVRSKLQIFDKK